MSNNEEVRECTDKGHPSRGSKYPKNAVPVDKFVKP